MHLNYVNVNGIPTKVITWGKKLNEIDNDREIVLCIPGNPGVTKFYTTFLGEIHRQLGHPVWILGHAGHDPFDSNDLPSLKSNEQLYDLKGQVEHKRAFIDQYIPKNTKIHFIGHSIGCYMILQLLKDAQVREVALSKHLLFPTIERMAESPNGRLLTNVVYYLNSLILFMAWIFTFFPLFLKQLLIKVYTTYFKVDDEHFDTIVEFIKPDTLEKVFFLAYDEMDKVRERDDVVLRENKTGMKLYYGATDRWCPQAYCRDLVDDIEGIDAEICTRGLEHAFVLRFSTEMANLVTQWMQ